jgi:predicted transcriptional regulator
VVESGVETEMLVDRLGRTKRLILIELSKGAAGYKKLSKKLRIGLDTIRSHVKTGKHSKSLTQLGLIHQEEKGWSVTELGSDILKHLKRDPEYAPFFVLDPASKNEENDT